MSKRGEPSSSASVCPPSSATFSFTAPFPLSSGSGASSPTKLKQRRVSLALPSAPRLVAPYDFRDDTDVNAHIAETPVLEERKGKIRKIVLDDEDSSDLAKAEKFEKRSRKMWNETETNMLVAGCNRVRPARLSRVYPPSNIPLHSGV